MVRGVVRVAGAGKRKYFSESSLSVSKCIPDKQIL
jgi:hypothetical protein